MHFSPLLVIALFLLAFIHRLTHTHASPSSSSHACPTILHFLCHLIVSLRTPGPSERSSDSVRYRHMVPCLTSPQDSQRVRHYWIRERGAPYYVANVITTSCSTHWPNITATNQPGLCLGWLWTSGTLRCQSFNVCVSLQLISWVSGI